jgi:acyl-CoA synthetase (AMP-forming)/AMP-acid ligase II
MLSRVLPVPISPIFSHTYVKTTAGQVGARHAFTTPALMERLLPVDTGVHALAYGLGARSADVTWIPSWTEGTAKAVAMIRERADRTSVDDVCIIMPTSGSTGDPKMVVRRYLGFVRYAHYVGRHLRGEQPSRFIALAALTHAFGLHMFTINLTLGGALCIPSQIDTGARLAEVRELRPTAVPTTPRILRSLHNQHRHELEEQGGEGGRLFGPETRFLLTAGGKSDPELLKFVTSQGITALDFYGSCEASIIALTPPGRWREGIVGQVVDDCTVRVGRDGELEVKSPGLMVEYYGQPHLTEEAVTADGFYRTGDIGELAPDGSLKVVGRKRDVFTGLFPNIYPEQIEIQLEAIPGVSQAFLFGDYRPYLTAYMVLEEDPGGGESPDGFLPPAGHHALYHRLGLALARINQPHERVERVVGFALFGHAFPEDVYGKVGPGKVRRMRKAFEASFQGRIAALYDGTLEQGDPQLVPSTERRLRPREPAGPRRRHVRVASRQPCALRRRGGAQEPATTIDIGLGGAAVQTGGLWEVGEVVDLALGEDPAIEVAARVLEQRGDRLRLFFVDPPTSLQGELARLLEAELARGQSLVERRRDRRVACSVRVQITDGGSRVLAVTTDLSRDGVGIRLEGSPPEAAGVLVSFPDFGAVDTPARVIWRARNTFAVQFGEPAAGFAESLDSVLAGLFVR